MIVIAGSLNKRPVLLEKVQWWTHRGAKKKSVGAPKKVRTNGTQRGAPTEDCHFGRQNRVP